FSKCREHIDVTPYMDQCLEDLCRCRPSVSSDCHCSVVSQFARECAKLGHEPNGWRTHTSCYRSCLGNQQYVECASACASTCENAKRNYCSTECTGGCECAPDTYWDASIEKCVLLQSCSCTHAGKFYKAGATRQEKCENCVCTAAKWTCNKVDCPATALAYGFSHFTTFDGSHFNYPGRCTYRFVSHKSWNLFDILIATKECGSGGRFTCVRKNRKVTKKKTIVCICCICSHIASNNQPPTADDTLMTLCVLTLFLRVNMRVLTRIKVTMQKGYKMDIVGNLNETLIGLGGRYNLKTTDDLTTAYGYESTQIDFGNSWEVYQKCDDIPVSGNQKDACADNQYLANDAETNCRIITTGEAFAACRLKLNGDRYFEACKFDVCACETGNDCYCDAIALFAQRCLEVGVAVDWRTPESCELSETWLTCSGGKTYQVNGTSCGRTCRSITEQRTCTKNDYVEGCNCPEDTYLSSDGTCVTLDLCPCFHENSWIQAGHVVHQNNIACFCVNGAMSCNRPVDLIKLTCPATMQVLNCSKLEPGNPGAACAKTCLTRNSMNCEGLTCQSGCKCPDGLVIYNGACIEPTTCPCEFQGKVYQVGNTTKSGCAVIECTTTGWKEISRDKCYTTCSAVGGAYYKTFDGLRTSFRGSCEYLMATDNCWGNNDNYDYRITVKSHDCPGSNNAMCATTVTAILGYTKVTLEKGQEPKQEILSSRGAIIKYHVNIKTRGIFTIVDTRLIRIIWDNSTRVYLQFKEEMMNQTQCGLCGNNNGDGADDKKAPNGDLPVTDVAFANSWKTSELCANIPEKNVTESCGSKLTWAQKKCAVIRSEVFAECRAKIDSDYFYEKCVEETCSCDTGGDCECFCTAVSDYAFQCGQNGVPVSWRNPDTCPLMCESYNTDDNCLWKYAPCSDVCIHTCCTTCIDGCFEGCHPKCTNGTIFNEQSNTCVKPLDCPDKSICDAKNCICIIYFTISYDITDIIVSQTSGTFCDNAGCYNIQKTKLPCSDDVTCPDYANKKSSLSPGACCETYTCGINEKKYIRAYNKVIKLWTKRMKKHCNLNICTTHCIRGMPSSRAKNTVLTDGTTECVKHNCTCPDRATMNETCVAPVTFSACVTDCESVISKVKKGETWDHPHDDCLSSMCSCDYNKCDIVDVPRYECPAAPMTTCATRQQPMRVTNADNKCCSHYECPCLCSVFGDPHYITFDGRQYTFMGECHYTLAKYRDSDKFHIYSDNTVCVRTSEFVGTCLKKIFIKWDSTLVQISYVESYDYAQAVKVNGTTLTSLPWSKGGIVVRYEFKSIVVTIPEINLWMKYLLTRMPAVFIKVSPTLMFNKTVGLCGTCTNQQLDDYEGSNGTLIGGSTEFGYDWEVNVTDEEYCNIPSYEDNLMPLPEWCKNCTEAHCQALVAPAFAECNKVHPPSGFVKACQYDASALSKVKSYATLCLGSGMCVDWRKDNNCSMECSGDLVYRSCLNKCTAMQTCDNYLDECESEELEAGCFCPDGLIL
uniref:VWFD domain-containing protein n=1 Tax=Ciona intestinalis TaxID=7719 RepID=F6SVM8_CIOIN